MFHGFRLLPLKRIYYFCNRCKRSVADYSKDYYDILGVARDATPQEIKNTFYKLSKKYHPDVTGSSPESILTQRFIAIKEAYDVLKDPDSRRDYDTHYAQAKNSDSFRQTYESQTYQNGNGEFKFRFWRSNRYAGSNEFRSRWPYSDAHLKRVFEELQRRGEEYEKTRRRQDEEYWERFYRADRERHSKRRHEMPRRPNVKLAFDSWFNGPLQPYLPYLSVAVIIYMIGFFLASLYTVISDRKILTGTKIEEGNKMNFEELVTQERLAYDLENSNVPDEIDRIIQKSS